MKELALKSTIYAADFSELTDQERELIEPSSLAVTRRMQPSRLASALSVQHSLLLVLSIPTSP